MSSSRQADARSRWRRPATWSLRARLVSALVALLAVVCVLLGVFTQAAVYQVQVGQLDNRLTEAARRSQNMRDHPLPPRGGGQPDCADIGPPVQGPGTVAANFRGGHCDMAQYLDPDGTWQSLSAGQVDVLTRLPVDGRPYTRNLQALGDYRLVATRAPDGDLLVTGLSMSDVYGTRNLLIAVEAVLGLTVLAIGGLAGALIIQHTLRPLQRVAATAARVAELPLDRGEVALSVRVPRVDTDPRTEVGQVGAALNRMLRHVAAALAARQASETRVRHFVADASHELRTPLAAIRGYAELARRVTDAVPPDVAHAMSRVESEAARMTVLVDDLLLLARLDSGRPLAADEVDLSRLVIDAVSDAHVAGPDHTWRLDLPDESVTVTGDGARLHQVLANLLANARVHTPPGTTVTTSLTVTGDRVALAVTDDGPGIAPDLLPEVFDRFARGDTSRSRAAGSTGLGLAIVAAVVEAHGGDVAVRSRPGETVFTVELPVRDPQPAHSEATTTA